MAEPVSIYVNTYGRSHVNMTDGEIAKKIAEMFDLRPKAVSYTHLIIPELRFFLDDSLDYLEHIDELLKK